MNRPLKTLSHTEREAMSIADLFMRALAYANLNGGDTAALAADYIDSELRCDDMPEANPAIDAFVALLRRYAVEDENGKIPGEEGYHGKSRPSMG